MDGALIIDKPAGITSHDVVARVRKILGERRVGHTGTLDPFATGVLVVLLGRATRLAQFLSGAEKEYDAVIRLGYGTDTGDVTGKRMNAEGFTTETQKTRSFSPEEIEAALASLRGDIEQTPPMYSAKKIEGKKLYELARRGEEVERKPVRVTVNTLEVKTLDDSLLKHNDDGTCDLAVRVVCSAGTYVRSLAEAVGERLGAGGHLFELRRTRAGELKIEDAISLERLSKLSESDTVEQSLVSPDAALVHLPAVQLAPDDVTRVRQGIDLRFEDAEASRWSDGQRLRLRGANGDLISVGTYDRGRKIVHPEVVIRD